MAMRKFEVTRTACICGLLYTGLAKKFVQVLCPLMLNELFGQPNISMG